VPAGHIPLDQMIMHYRGVASQSLASI